MKSPPHQSREQSRYYSLIIQSSWKLPEVHLADGNSFFAKKVSNILTDRLIYEARFAYLIIHTKHSILVCSPLLNVEIFMWSIPPSQEFISEIIKTSKNVRFHL